MWMLSFIPDEWLLMIVNGVLILGAVLTFLSFFVINRILRFFPPLAAWHTLIQVISVIILLVGVYFKGSYQTEQEWRQAVAKVEEELKAAKEQANNKTVEIQEKVVYRDRVIKEQGKTLIQFVDREVVKKEEIVKYIENCPVPAEIIDIHNQATKLNDAAKGNKK